MSIEKDPTNEEPQDRVKVKLGIEQDVRIVERYNFHSSIFQQPSAFTAILSGGHGAADVIKRYPPGPIKGVSALYIGKYRQFTGLTDAVDAFGDANRTNVEIRGRDLMSLLHDQDIEGDRSFNNETYEGLFRAALKDVGQEHKIIEISNAANRAVRAGVTKGKIKVIEEPVKVDEVKQLPSGGGFRNVVVAKMGESWLAFLERHFAKLGLFPWSDANGNFVLSRPNAQQSPLFYFYRKKGQLKSVSNVKSFRFTNDTTLRFTRVVVFARNLGKKFGHNHTNGSWVDPEMEALGINRRRVYRDAQVTTEEEAAYFARKKIAEANRAGWKLQYTISGHSAPLMDDISSRGIVVPDTVARVDDDDLNIHENLYIESVEYKAPPKETVITMMRPADLIFGEFQAEDGKKKMEQRVRKMLSFTRNRDPIEFTRTGKNDVILRNESSNFHRAAIGYATRPKRK